MNTILSLQKNNTRALQPCRKGNVVNRVLLLLIGCTILIQAQSQTDKRLALADQYFAAGEYFTAAGLYGQFLKPVAKSRSTSDFPLNLKKNTEGRIGKYESKTDVLFKQAESYRLANYWTEAATLYKECFEKDSAKFASALYWSAVCQRSMGDYTAAEENINRFLSAYAGNPFAEAATKEKQALQFIRTQLSRPDSILYHIQKLNTSFETAKGIFAPAAGTGNQFMITSTQTDSVAAGINPYHNRLFTSVLTNDGLQNIAPVNIASIDSSFNQGAASISANGKHLYFTQWKKDIGQPSTSSIYYSTKTANGWSRPVLLASVNQTGHSSKQPFCSADGKYLFFASDRNGGMGNFDIWYAPIKADGNTGEPVNAGAVVNTAGNEQSPFYHGASGTLVFSSDKMPGMGGYDLYASKGWGKEWKTPENMGYPVNSSRDDVYFFSTGKESILDNAFFSSDRGSECCLSTYTVSKTPKTKWITGMIRDCGDSQPLADAAVIMKDASGNSLQATSNAEGKYSFELTDNNPRQFLISKEGYNEKAADMTIEGKNETHWRTDTLINTGLCIEKKALVIKVENVVTLYFDFDRSKLDARAIAQMDSIYNVLVEDTAATVQISGYTDGLGQAKYNELLSGWRAKACADYLIKKGIDPARISFESFGSCCPVEMELINGRDNVNGRSKNRRALINISRSN